MAGLTVTALGAATACASSSTGAAGPADPSVTGAAPQVRFVSAVSRQDQSLRIDYELINQSGEDLVALNQVPRYSAAGVRRSDPAAVYVTGRGDSGRVEISKRAFPTPATDRMSWAQAPEILGVVVHPGRSVSEALTVALPLRRDHPYGDDIGYGTIKLPDPVREVVFCLGVLRARDARTSAATDGAELTLPHISGVTSAQHLLCSDPINL